MVVCVVFFMSKNGAKNDKKMTNKLFLNLKGNYIAFSQKSITGQKNVKKHPEIIHKNSVRTLTTEYKVFYGVIFNITKY